MARPARRRGPRRRACASGEVLPLPSRRSYCTSRATRPASRRSRPCTVGTVADPSPPSATRSRDLARAVLTEPARPPLAVVSIWLVDVTDVPRPQVGEIDVPRRAPCREVVQCTADGGRRGVGAGLDCSDRAKVGTPSTATSIGCRPAPALSQCPARGQRSSTGSDSGTGSARDTTPACFHTAASVRVLDATGACALVRADVAQLVEHHLAKVRVAGSNPVVRSEAPTASTGPRSVGVRGSPAEWPSGLGKGLQSPVRGFDSRLRLVDATQLAACARSGVTACRSRQLAP